MFVIIGQAASTEGNPKYPEGEIHSAMVFVSSDTSEEAQQVAIAELEDGGWTNVRLRKIGTLAEPPPKSQDVVIRDAYESAVTDRASIIIYQGVDDEYVD